MANREAGVKSRREKSKMMKTKKEGRKEEENEERKRETGGKKKLGGPPIRVLSQSLWEVRGRVGFRWPSSCDALLELDRVCWVADTQFIYRNKKEKDTFTTYFCIRNKPEGKKDKKK